jgi:hypothetical protein
MQNIGKAPAQRLDQRRVNWHLRQGESGRNNKWQMFVHKPKLCT